MLTRKLFSLCYKKSIKSLNKNLIPLPRLFSTNEKAAIKNDSKKTPEPSVPKTDDTKAPSPPPKPKEQFFGDLEPNQFKAQTQEILQIVSKAIYTNKEIFLRELISNSCDAIEQFRYHLLKSDSSENRPSDLRIDITTDQTNNRLVLEDNGIGMTRNEMVENLGTIARSGSKDFMKGLKDADSASAIIGQFGVGFYSSFMVSDKVEVYTKSQRNSKEDACYWVSNGKGKFSVSKAKNVNPGTKIIINLNKEYGEYSNPASVEKIIQKYSNFVKYPIYLNGKRVNLLGALWRENPASVSSERHAEFFKHLTNAYDPPLFRIHFHKDFPLSLYVLLYVPKIHSEKYGNARMKPGVDIYSRSVLIQKASADLLPGWMRFVKGVVDSEDLGLNISRENTQNSRTISKMRRILVKATVAYLKNVAKKSPERFSSFFNEYSVFLKEGVCTDDDSKDLLATLLRFDSSNCEAGRLRSFDDYVSAMKTDQKNIYYLVTTNKSSALRSPYYESLKKAGREVLFLYSPVDEFVMQALGEYEKRPLVSIETNKVHKNDMATFKGKKHEFELSENQTDDLCQWIKETIGSARLKKVVASDRLKEWPAIITGHENASVQMMMQLSSNDSSPPLSAQVLEINPSHKVIRGLFYALQEDPKLAKSVAEQLVDNALIEAGLMNDPRGMLSRCNDIMAAALDVDGIEVELRQKKTTKTDKK